MAIKFSRAKALLAVLVLTLGVSLGSLLSVSSPAQAATISNISVTSTGPLTAGQVNAAPVVITYTQLTEMPADSANSSWVGLSGVTWVTEPSSYQCGSLVTVTGTLPNTSTVNVGCSAGGGGAPPHQMVFGQSITNDPSAVWPAGTVWTFTFEAGTINLPYAASMAVNVMTMLAVQDGTHFDEGATSAALTGYIPPAPDPEPEPDPGALPLTAAPTEGTLLVALFIFGFGAAFLRAKALGRRTS